MNQSDKMMTKVVEPLKTGELLVKEGLIRLDDIDAVLSIQEKRAASVSLNKSRLFGMILCDLNLITPIDNYAVLYKYNRLKSIRSALVSEEILDEKEAQRACEEAKNKNIPLISFLVKERLVTATRMQRLVFDLFHVPFRSISDFVFNEADRSVLTSVVDRKQSEAHRVIPMVLKDATVLIGITDPDSILFVRELNERHPQYRFRVLFIPFSGFSWFHKIIYEIPGSGSEKALDLSLLLNFKATVTDPVREKGAIKMLYKRYERLRTLAGNPERGSFEKAFARFIQENHGEITRKYNCDAIEFFLEKQGKKVNVIAFPIR